MDRGGSRSETTISSENTCTSISIFTCWNNISQIVSVNKILQLSLLTVFMSQFIGDMWILLYQLRTLVIR